MRFIFKTVFVLTGAVMGAWQPLKSLVPAACQNPAFRRAVRQTIAFGLDQLANWLRA